MSPITEKQRGKIKTRRIGWGLVIYIGFGVHCAVKMGQSIQEWTK